MNIREILNPLKNKKTENWDREFESDSPELNQMLGWHKAIDACVEAIEKSEVCVCPSLDAIEKIILSTQENEPCLDGKGYIQSDYCTSREEESMTENENFHAVKKLASDIRTLLLSTKDR